MVLDGDLAEFGNMETTRSGMEVLDAYNGSALAEQYHDLVYDHRHNETPAHWRPEGKADVRFQRFVARLRQRPEKRIVVVAHKHVIGISTGLNLDTAEVAVRALRPDGEFTEIRGMWRELPHPRCWAR